MLANIPLVNQPECESLGFDHNIDAYRQYSGPANLAGKRIISSETGANFGEDYQETIPELLWDVKRLLVGSVNHNVFHGWPYSGNYGNTTWPGFTTFAYVFSEMHGRHQPAFIHYRDWLDFVARCQYIGQTGGPKVDLVFYHKQTASYHGATVYEPNDLVAAGQYPASSGIVLMLTSTGYTYEYLTPDNFALSSATVGKGVFAPDRQAFKAMVVRGNETLTQFGVEKIVQYAHQGLQIIFDGGVPSNVSGHHPGLSAALTKELKGITSLKNVHVTSYGHLASTLESLNIQPRTAVKSNGTWYTHWREHTASSTNYVFVYSDGSSTGLGRNITTGTVSFESTGRPYLFNPWTGSETPVSAYEQTSTHTTIYLELAADQVVIVAFKNERNRDLYIKSADIAVDTVSSGSRLTVLTGYNTKSQSFSLSNGKMVKVAPMSAESFSLKNWKLTIESWTPPSDPYNVELPPTKTNTTHTLPSLVPWSSISESFRNVSGLGYYSATFDWPPADGVSGAFIDFGAIFHTARASINGKQLPPLDLSWAKADIGSYLKKGTNKVDVLVTTPLGNVLREYWNVTETSGKLAPAAGRLPVQAQYGLVSDVKVIPYRKDRLA